MPLTLDVLPGLYSVCRLRPDIPIPAWAVGEFLSITRSSTELSIVAESRLVPPDTRGEGPFRALRVRGTLDFSLVGVIAGLAAPLAAAGVSIFVISTFETDYLLVRVEQFDIARAALTRAGYTVASESTGGDASHPQ